MSPSYATVIGQYYVLVIETFRESFCSDVAREENTPRRMSWGRTNKLILCIISKPVFKQKIWKRE